MNLSESLSQHVNALYFGDNWTGTNFQKAVQDLNRHQAVESIYSLNSIAALLYHTNYYLLAQIDVFKGLPLIAHDKYSFDLKPIESEADWNKLQAEIWTIVKEYIELVKNMSNEKLDSVFFEEKYGSIHKAILGIIEHSHYHLGQITLIKKIILQKSKK